MRRATGGRQGVAASALARAGNDRQPAAGGGRVLGGVDRDGLGSGAPCGPLGLLGADVAGVVGDSGRFLDKKADPQPFKGVRREK